MGNRRENPPNQPNQHTKTRVERREDPRRCLIEQDHLYPVLDKAGPIGQLTRLKPEPGLKSCERTGRAKPRLNYYEADGQQMRISKGASVDPSPMAQVANNDEDQATDHEKNNREVQQQDCISKRGIHDVVLQ